MIRQILNYDVTINEYLCPICERLSNTVIPIMPPISTFVPLLKSSKESFIDWITHLQRTLKNKVSLLHFFMILLKLPLHTYTDCIPRRKNTQTGSF